MIKLERLFRSRGVKYSTSGKHATEGHVNIQCPFCGASDPSFHLGISVINGAYHCWRTPKHSGYNIDFLLSRVFKISKKESQNIISEYSDLSFLPAKEKDGNKIWSFMETFVDPSLYKTPVEYLQKRGFYNIKNLCNKYNIKYCTYGEWAGRIILPIYDDEHNLVSFTARDVTGTSGIRYKTLNAEYSKKNYNELLFNSNSRMNGGDLILVEGPMDAMRVEGISGSISSWSLMGLELSLGKIEVIKKYSKMFSRIYLVIDNDQPKIKALYMSQELEKYINRDISIAFPPSHVKDVGELDNYDLQTWRMNL
jgi:hypothetical protein